MRSAGARLPPPNYHLQRQAPWALACRPPLARPGGAPNDTVICISSDGSFMMNVQELGTVKRKQLPLKIVLLDNQRLGMVRQWQQLFFQERYSETL